MGYTVEHDDGDEEYSTNNEEDIRDPIVNFALRVFHSLEDFSHEHPKHVENQTNLTKTEVENIQNVDNLKKFQLNL